MKLTLKYEKKFISIHTIIILLITLYALIAWIYDDCNQFVIYGLVIMIILYIINIVLHRLKYFNSIYIFYIIKLIQLIIASLIIFEENRFLSNTGVILYILLSVEAMIVLGIDDKLIRYSAFVLTILPFVIATLYIYIFGILIFDTVFFMLLKIIVLIGVYLIFYAITEELKNQVNIQKNLCLKVNNKNEELRISQQQFQLVHNQLVQQKLELEEANERLNKFTAEMYIQNELLRYISSVLDIDELMELVTDSILGAIGVDTCSLVIYDINQDFYHYKVKSTHRQDYLQPFIEAVKSGKLDQYFNIGKPYIDNNVKSGLYDFTSEREVGSLVIIPILNEKTTYGLLIAEHESSNIINENSIQFFQGIANQINIAINNANLYAKMEEMAKRDGLTGVYNRNHLQKILDELSKDVEQNNKRLSLVLFDIDKFKIINDTYGHLFGDEVLKSIANIAEKYASLHGGIIGRYGGEEFVIAFPEKTLDESFKIMEQIHNCIIEQKIFNKDKQVYVNISTGITSYPEVCQNPNELLNRADNAMYSSKANGRGRITIDNINL